GQRVGAQGARRARLAPREMEVGGESAPGRAAGLVMTQRAARELARQDLVGRAADDGLGEERQRAEFSGREVAGVETTLVKHPLVVGRVTGGVVQDLPETLALSPAQRILRQPLRPIELAQDAQPRAAILQIP